MDFLYSRVFGPTLNSKTVSHEIKSGINLTIGRMNQRDAEGMIKYFWLALASENSIRFSELLKNEGLTRFEDVMEDFRRRFNDKWLRS